VVSVFVSGDFLFIKELNQVRFELSGAYRDSLRCSIRTLRSLVMEVEDPRASDDT
jgi:hypothetical protein